MKKINENTMLGEIVSIFPGSSDIFNKYKVDYCCGGHDTLKAALEEKGLELTPIITELNDNYENFLNSNCDYKDWRNETPQELIKYIERTHHDYTKKELNEIDYLMFKVLKVHFKHHSEELLKLHRLFGQLKIELQAHLVKEEENLFPLIKEYELSHSKDSLSQIKQFMKETEDEHEAAGDILKDIEKVTNDFTAPEDSCNTYRLVYAKLEALEKDLFNHIYLENSVLFKMLN